MVQSVGTVGRTLAGRNFWRHLACGNDNAMYGTYRCILCVDMDTVRIFGNNILSSTWQFNK